MTPQIGLEFLQLKNNFRKLTSNGQEDECKFFVLKFLDVQIIFHG